MNRDDLRSSLNRARLRTVYVLLLLMTYVVAVDNADAVQVLLALSATLLTALGIESAIAYVASKQAASGADPEKGAKP